MPLHTHWQGWGLEYIQKILLEGLGKFVPLVMAKVRRGDARSASWFLKVLTSYYPFLYVLQGFGIRISQT
jgi:hypothetical protein